MRVPNFKDPEVTKFLVQWNQELEQQRKDLLSRITANHSVLLQSPSSKIYEVTVSDAGALTVTLVLTP